MRTFLRVGLVGLALLLAAPAAGQDKGFEAVERGDYGTAMREWRPRAEAGDAYAQYNLGIMYHHGDGVPQDYAEAAKWFRLAAEQGDADAQYNLGNMFYEGAGVPQDYAEAAKWFRLAAEQGDAEARHKLDVMSNSAMHGATGAETVASIYFDNGDEDEACALVESAGPVLDQLVEEWRAAGSPPIVVAGHDSSPDKSIVALQISFCRTNVVATGLERRGIPSGKITRESYGNISPAVPLTDGPMSALNRRVEILW